MKALRAIKIILFIAAILCLLVSACGNFFILKDACDNEVAAQEVHEALDKYDFSIGSIFKGKAEETPSDAGTENTSAENADTPTVDNAVTPPDDEAAAAETETELVKSAYKAGGHMGIINGLMKAGNARINLSFLKDLKFDLCKFGEIGMRPAAADNSEPAFEVNLLLAIAFAALTLAFILHLFTKNRRKNVWGILMMVLGYILFTAFFALGQLLANIDINALLKTEVTDFAAYRIYVVCGCTLLGLIVGLGYIRCGARAMKRRRRKESSRR